MTDNESRNRIVVAVILVILALMSFFLIAHFTAPQDARINESTVGYLDGKRDEVLGLAGASAASSVAITALPGDAGTPIAEELAHLSGYFTLILTAIYFEKFLVTVAGTAAFKIFIPVALLLFALSLFVKSDLRGEQLKRIAGKLVIFALAVFLVVPTSVSLSRLVENNLISQNETAAVQTQEPEEVTPAPSPTESEKTGNSVIDSITSFITDTADTLQETTNNAVNSVTDAVEDKVEAGKNLLNKMVDQIAVLLITACVIPIAVLALIIWILKMLFSMDIKMPKNILKRR